MIRQWLILSPIPYGEHNGRKALDQEQIPGEAHLHPQAGQRIKVINPRDDGERVWQKVELPDYLIDFNDLLYARAEWCAAYAVCYIDCDQELTNVSIAIGSDDQAKVYLNGKEIYRQESPRHYVPDQDVVTGQRLNAGRNLLVFKVINQTRDWLGSIRFTDGSSQSLKCIRVSLNEGLLH